MTKQQQRPKPQSKRYEGGRGFRTAVHEDVVQPLQSMRTGMQGSMAARWGGATTDFDWRQATNMWAQPLIGPRKVKKGKGRPEAPEEQAPVTGPTTPGPMTLQSHASPESSLLPSDQSKSGMASDIGPAAYSASLPMSPMGSALPWTPGRGVGASSPPQTAWPSESSAYPAGGAYGGMATDSSIWPSSSTVSLGADTSIYPGTVSKSAIGGRKDRRPAGMNRGALDQIGVVRRNGGWPG